MWNKLEIDKTEVKKKMKVLLAQYCREKQRIIIKENLKVGIGIDEIYSTS